MAKEETDSTSPVERICTQCGHRNPLTVARCAQCDASVEEPWLAKRDQVVPVRNAEIGVALAAGTAMLLRLAWNIWRNREWLGKLATLGPTRPTSAGPRTPTAHSVLRGYHLRAWGDQHQVRQWILDQWQLEADE
ncbi:MAG: hypothetical protein GXP41_08485 [Chloroflexi bacterium]|nr:hypothetical protein [Chloroflexota bacterium]